MQIRSIVLTFAALVAASPAANPNRQAANLVPRQIAGLCPGIDSPLCCEAGVDGILDLTCSSRMSPYAICTIVRASNGLTYHSTWISKYR